jgi:hypothetical protein
MNEPLSNGPGLRAKSMTLYHRTDAAETILSGGFIDHEGSFGLEDITLRGVFVSDVPLIAMKGPKESSFWKLRCHRNATSQITK